MRSSRRARRAAALLALLLGACSRWDLSPVAEQPVTGDAFQAALKAEYLDLAAFERGEHDWRDLLFYRNRAEASGAGREVLPQAVAERDLPAAIRADLEAARERVLALYRGRGRERAPAELAQAQAAFDCWLEQQEEGHQTDHIAACRQRFATAIAAAEDKAALKGDLVLLLPDDDGAVGRLAVGDEVLESAGAALEFRGDARRPVDLAESEVEGIFGVALGAQPAPPRTYTLYFEEASTELTAESAPLLEEIAADLRSRRAPDIVVIGHTDRVGTTAYNDALSHRRAAAISGFVRDLLAREGIPPLRIAAEGRGEREPLVPTADGVEEPRNRRVELVVR